MTIRSHALSLTLLALAAPGARLLAEDAAPAPAAAPAAAPAPAPAATPAAPAAAAAAPAPDLGPQFTGFIETTYNYNTNGARTNKYHSFDSEANTFALNHAQLAVSGHPKTDADLTYYASIDYGSDNFHSSDEPASYFSVEQAYGEYTKGEWSLKAGKFVTYMGIETIDDSPTLNPTITRGFLFSLIEPFTHTGAVVIYQPTAMWDIEAGLCNGWDKVTDNNQGKDFLFKIGYTPTSTFTIMLDGTYGAEGDTTAYAALSGTAGPTPPNDNQRLALDVVASYTGVNNLTLNFQADFGTEKHASATFSTTTPPTDNNGVPNASWFGLGVQPVYKINDKWSVGGRVEFLDDADGAITLIPDTDAGATTPFHKTTLFTIAVAPSYQVSPHFVARAEARYDSANEKAFAGKDQVVDKKSQGELALESLFNF